MTHHTDKRHRAVEETVEGGREKSIDGTGWRRLATIHLALRMRETSGQWDWEFCLEIFMICLITYTRERRTPKCSKESGTREIQMHHIYMHEIPLSTILPTDMM